MVAALSPPMYDEPDLSYSRFSTKTLVELLEGPDLLILEMLRYFNMVVHFMEGENLRLIKKKNERPKLQNWAFLLIDPHQLGLSLGP